jgi:type II secretory pathway pseudopilin PulG
MTSGGKKNFAHKPGFMALEAMIALIIIAALVLVLGLAVTMQDRVAQRLEERRSAAHLAEAAMIQLQTGRPATVPAGATLRVERIGGSQQWMKVAVTYHGKTVELDGFASGTEVPR